MNDPTDPSAAKTGQSGEAVVRWCDWHGGLTGGATLIGVVARLSGADVALWACPTCLAKHRLTPYREDGT
ncbi:hypothetical protein [Streptomyces sp. NPDC003077]|uniref:hypothetical protein n=1 Tax=Streptomyces sp. NPDC003077 TaxID=3154443 RepID=UPI0033A63FD0